MLTDRQSRPLPALTSPQDPPSKREILEAALRLFARHGLHAVTIRDIADAAGYSNPAIFKFFKSKESLAIFLFERCYTGIYEKLATRVEADSSFDGRIRAILETFLEQMECDASGLLFVQDHLRELWPHVSKATRSRSIVGVFRKVLNSGVKQGAVSAQSNIELLSAAMLGALVQFARLAYFGEFRRPLKQYAAELETILRKIAISSIRTAFT